MHVNVVQDQLAASVLHHSVSRDRRVAASSRSESRDFLEIKPINATLLMAESKPFWSALYHSLTLTETQNYEYRRSSIYKNIGAMYQIKNDG